MARRSWTKVILITLVALVLIASLGITFTIGWRPLIGAKKRTLTDRRFESTPQRLARGKYVVTNGLQKVFFTVRGQSDRLVFSRRTQNAFRTPTATISQS